MPSGISSSGLFWRIEIMICVSFTFALGPILFWNSNESNVMKQTTTMRGLKTCISEMPEALMAVSSLLSPRLPKVMSEESRMAKGNAWGTSIRPMYQKNWASTSIERPLPMSLSTYCQRNCIISTNWQMKKVPMNSRPNCRMMNMSNFLTLNIALWPFADRILLIQDAKLRRKNQIGTTERKIVAWDGKT